MMDETLFGMETELAFSALRIGEEDPNQEILFDLPRPMHSAVSSTVADLLVADFFKLADEQICSLRDYQTNGIYLANGSRLYLDAGRHPEFCTPECRSPEELVRWQLAGERILAGLVEDLAILRPDHAFALFRCNVDYGGMQSTWGCHESYQHRSDEVQMSRHLIPHLVSRIIYTGAGGLNNRIDRPQFLISPRVPHLMHTVGADSQHERALYHTKDEQLGESDFHRLHLICGESNSSQLSTYLKFGTTALIVRLIEAGLCEGGELGFDRPLEVMNRIARDVRCEKESRVSGGRRLTAIQIQREYLAMVEEQLDADFMPDWAPRVCERWREALDDLENDSPSLSTRLDWKIKHALFEDRLERRGTSWSELTRWEGLGAELCEIDTRFGELGSAGLFRRLDEAGALEHRLSELGSVEEAMESAPPGGRAEVRGRAIRELREKDDSGRYRCGWEAILDDEEGRTFDMSDPFGRNAEWRDADLGWRRRSPHSRFRHNLLDELNQGVGLYSGCMFSDAVERLAAVAQRARAAGEHEIESQARFWSASAYHDAGRLRQAERVLSPILETVVENASLETACRVLTRHAVILIDGPAERSRIEESIARARRCMEEGDGVRGASRIALAEARLFGAIGDYGSAILRMEEALRLERDDYISFARSSHQRWMIYYLLRVKRLDRANFYLEEWFDEVKRGVGRPESRIMFHCAESLIARARGDHDRAFERARDAVEHAEGADRNRYRTSARCALVESAIEVGDLNAARPHVEALERWEEIEIGEQHCDVHLVTAAYHRAVEGREREAKAVLAEAAALGVARRMDRLLGTRHHEREMGEGLRPVG
ncbi:MAG: proteasome accessory factor PafA2 family protein [bacterium]|nr:proteasome accessory factor PafA2 family protein [bacterium]